MLLYGSTGFGGQNDAAPGTWVVMMCNREDLHVSGDLQGVHP